MQDYDANGRMTSQGLVVERGGEKKGIVGIVVRMVGIEGIVVGMVSSEVAGSGGSVTCGTVGMVGKDGIWNANRDHDNWLRGVVRRNELLELSSEWLELKELLLEWWAVKWLAAEEASKCSGFISFPPLLVDINDLLRKGFMFSHHLQAAYAIFWGSEINSMLKD
ncbi:hypothetical protein F0562_030264 [Nyssa sinensis]|uniref:Uncharacterized protein n=1 Tax=Nyssa sinensis TaxID=561372 RepID=A0A5J5B2A1_9ASTE|nr:hypothetical protein F0562_030264 [Nyssa sinensis]